MAVEHLSADAVVIGGGHNGLTCAAYLAEAGRSVIVLERSESLGGAVRSARVFPRHDAWLSQYAYLVSLLPSLIVDELGLDITLRRRRYLSYTPTADGGILIDAHGGPASSRLQLGVDAPGWDEFGALTGAIAEAVFPTLTEPLPSADALRRRVGDDAWKDLVERPIGEVLERLFSRDEVRGLALTDALIGTFASAHDLRANRCFLYHVIGGGTGFWDVPVGGMGTVSAQLADAAERRGVELRTGAEVVAVRADGHRVVATLADGSTVTAAQGFANVAPAVLARLLGEAPVGPAPEGSQLKVNLLVSHLPRLRDPAVRPEEAFAGTFHVNEGYGQLEQAYRQAACGHVPDVVPLELYCHTLTDPSILSPELQASGAQTMTLFALHLPARLFCDHPGRQEEATTAVLASLDSVLDEPIRECLLDEDCIDVVGPLDLEARLGMPGGNIFHRDLQWPFAERVEDEGRWGVETEHATVFVCGAGTRRGGGVSGIPGRNAAMAALERAT